MSEKLPSDQKIEENEEIKALEVQIDGSTSIEELSRLSGKFTEPSGDFSPNSPFYNKIITKMDSLVEESLRSAKTPEERSKILDQYLLGSDSMHFNVAVEESLKDCDSFSDTVNLFDSLEEAGSEGFPDARRGFTVSAEKAVFERMFELAGKFEDYLELAKITAIRRSVYGDIADKALDKLLGTITTTEQIRLIEEGTENFSTLTDGVKEKEDLFSKRLSEIRKAL